MPRKKLSAGEVTDKIEVRMPASLKQGAVEASRAHGDGDVSSWVRGLIRAELTRLGMTAPPPRPKRKDGR